MVGSMRMWVLFRVSTMQWGVECCYDERKSKFRKFMHQSTSWSKVISHRGLPSYYDALSFSFS